jgi:hypothetical protein
MRVGILPTLAFFFETGITFEIPAQKLDKNISVFTFCLLHSPFGY